MRNKASNKLFALEKVIKSKIAKKDLKAFFGVLDTLSEILENEKKILSKKFINVIFVIFFYKFYIFMTFLHSYKRIFKRIKNPKSLIIFLFILFNSLLHFSQIFKYYFV